jgi:hypothetical protein
VSDLTLLVVCANSAGLPNRFRLLDDYDTKEHANKGQSQDRQIHVHN